MIITHNLQTLITYYRTCQIRNEIKTTFKVQTSQKMEGHETTENRVHTIQVMIVSRSTRNVSNRLKIYFSTRKAKIKTQTQKNNSITILFFRENWKNVTSPDSSRRNKGYCAWNFIAWNKIWRKRWSEFDRYAYLEKYAKKNNLEKKYVEEKQGRRV